MKRRSLPALLLIACVLSVTAAAQQSSVYGVPDNISPAPVPIQPLPFSHKTHLVSGLVCMNCHVNADPGTKMGFPETSNCMLCHTTLAQDKPAIKDLLNHSASDRPIPWVRVYEIASTVTWGHRVHLDAGLQCETCHGDVRQMDAMVETKATRAMATCIGCHEAHEAPADCVTCHAWPTDKMLGVE